MVEEEEEDEVVIVSLDKLGEEVVLLLVEMMGYNTQVITQLGIL